MNDLTSPELPISDTKKEAKQASGKSFTFFDGIREVPLAQANDLKATLRLKMNGVDRTIAQIVQINNGNCVLDTWINLINVLKASQGLDASAVPFEVASARKYAYELRNLGVKPPDRFRGNYLFDFLTNADVLNLFSQIYEGGEIPTSLDSSENYFQFDGTKVDAIQATSAALDLLDEHPDIYPSGVMVISSRNHCHAIKKVGEGYLSIDPANHEQINFDDYTTPGHPTEYAKAGSILRIMTRDEVTNYLTDRFRQSTNADIFLLQHPIGANINF